MRRHRRRGVEVLELLLVTPVILLALLGAFEFSMLTLNQSVVTHATTVGAREAAKDPTTSEVLAEINNVLAAYDIQITDSSGSGTVLVIQNGSSPATPAKYGDPLLTGECNPPANPALQADEVRVTICIALDAAKTSGTPVMNAFNYCGFTFADKRFEVSAMAAKESL